LYCIVYTEVSVTSNNPQNFNILYHSQKVKIFPKVNILNISEHTVATKILSHHELYLYMLINQNTEVCSLGISL